MVPRCSSRQDASADMKLDLFGLPLHVDLRSNFEFDLPMSSYIGTFRWARRETRC